MSDALQKLRSMQKDELKKMAKEHQKNEENRGNFTPPDYEQIVYSPLELDKVKKLKFYRMLGWPLHLRHEDPEYSPKEVMISTIIDDKGNLKRFILPTREEDSSFILTRFIDKVLEGTYDQQTETKTYHHKDTKIFRQVFKNDRMDNKLETGWRPTKYVIMNVIDREMYEWHKENKHSVLISKKAGTMKNGSIFYEPGTTITMYDAIMSDDVAGAYGFPINYDFVVKKLSEKPWYKVYHSKEFEKYSSAYDSLEEFKKDYPFYNPEVHTGAITEEEMSWERYNIEELFKVSTYSKMLFSLKSFFKLFDETFGLHFLEELEDLASKEKKDNPKKDTTDSFKEKEETEEEKTVQETVPEDIPVKEETPTRSRKSTFDLNSLKEKGFLGIDEMTDEEKSIVSGYNEEKGTLTYNTEESLFACLNEPKCTNVSPESFHVCPKCGEKF